MDTRDSTRWESVDGRFAATTAATTTGPSPATVNAVDAARCPASHASSVRRVDGIRIPAKRFLGNRPAAAIRPTTIMITPLIAYLSAFVTMPGYRWSVDVLLRESQPPVLGFAQAALHLGELTAEVGEGEMVTAR